MRIGIFGHVGNQNLGDEALIAAVLENARHRHPEAELCGFTIRPHDTELRHGIPAFPICRSNGHRASAAPHSAWAGLRARLRRVPLLRVLVRAVRWLGRSALAVPLEPAFLLKAYRQLRGTDLLIVAGSGQLNDYWGGPWVFPFTLFKWSLLARATGTKVAFLSLGAGPLRTRLGKFFIRQALRLAHYRSYRDEDSRRCIVALGMPGEHVVVPDLVFSLPLDRPPVEQPSRRRVVGINPMPFCDDAYWPESDPRVFGNYLRVLASFADWLTERDYAVRFFATQLLVDHRVIDQVRGLMAHGATAGEERVLAGRINSFEEVIAVIDSLDLVVATRYHGALFALIRHKPVLSIAYQHKSVELLRQMGQAEYAIEIAHLTLGVLRERFLALERHSAEFTDALRGRLPAVRAALDRQYDHTFAVIERRGRLRHASCQSKPVAAAGSCARR